ncbi:MAG: hypothetical protein ACR2GY_07700 [Phycisphaerales bacterium]
MNDLKRQTHLIEAGSPWKAMLPVAIFTVAYTIAAAGGALALGNTEFLFYIVVMAVLIGIMLIVHARVHLPTSLLWAMSFWGLLHMAGGLVPLPESWPIDGEQRVLYSWWILPHGDGEGGYLKYDQVVHAYGFGIAIWLCWEALRGAVRAHTSGGELQPTFGVLFLLVAAGCGLGAMNEIVEFTATRFAETNVGGYENTCWDLVANAVGCIIAAACIRMRVGVGRTDA